MELLDLHFTEGRSYVSHDILSFSFSSKLSTNDLLSNSSRDLHNVGRKQSARPRTSNTIQNVCSRLFKCRKQRRDGEVHVGNFSDPEVTVTREECDTTSDLSMEENSAESPSCSSCNSCECWFEPNSRSSYWWSFLVSMAVIYNYWVIIYRYAFDEISDGTLMKWFVLDYSMDLIYLLDLLKGFRTAFLEEGVLQTCSSKIKSHFLSTTRFYIDCLCLLPIDVLYLSIGFNSLLRCLRLCKIYRLLDFLDITERHSNHPNLVRALAMLHHLLLIFHWNASLFYFMMEDSDAFNNDNFVRVKALVGMTYLHSLYWSVLSLSTISTLPHPSTYNQYLYTIVTMIIALLLFATIMGLVAHIISSMHFARKEFQVRMDDMKTYMMERSVPSHLQTRVIRWFDYLWATKKNVSESNSLDLLPDRLRAEIAIHIHLDTLKKVEIFQNTEAGFLKELVLRLEPVLFSPGDLICRKGEVGKEMYIVKRGRLHVVDTNDQVLAVLMPGSYFGEISILNMGDIGNRRTASVKSVGYSDLFSLKKDALWDVLKDYPAARVRLEAIAKRRLQGEEDDNRNKQKQQQTVKPFCQIERLHPTLEAKSSTASTSSRIVEALQLPAVKPISTSPLPQRKTSFITQGVLNQSQSRRSSSRSNQSDTTKSVHSMTSSMAPTDVKKSCPSPIASLKLSRDEIIWDDTEELMAETVT